MENLTTTTEKTKDLIETGEKNPKGLIGAIALAAIAIAGMAIDAIRERR